ncbi:MAG TPA: MarR family transcriptional regulator [Candidatus Saccharimonadales bacterium]|nr:MarR family transcriptional regulator [Candidatus Saccharimonadales bacterium]
MQRNELIDRIYENMGALKRGMLSSLQSIGGTPHLSGSQLELAFTIKHLQPVGVKQLATQLRLTPGAVSQVADALVQTGLVTRQHDETDRRKSYLSLTAEGDRVLHRVHQDRQALFRSVMEDMTDQELTEWLHIQQKLIDHLATITNRNTKE